MGKAFQEGEWARTWHTASMGREESEPGAEMRAVDMREVDRLDHEKKVNWTRQMTPLSLELKRKGQVHDGI